MRGAASIFFLLICAAADGGATCGKGEAFAGFLAVDLTHVCQRLPRDAAQCEQECRALRSCAADWPGSYARAFRPRRDVDKPMLCCRSAGVLVEQSACRTVGARLGQIVGKSEVFADIQTRISHPPSWRQARPYNERPAYVLTFGREPAAGKSNIAAAVTDARAAACRKCEQTPAAERTARCNRLLALCARLSGADAKASAGEVNTRRRRKKRKRRKAKPCRNAITRAYCAKAGDPPPPMCRNTRTCTASGNTRARRRKQSPGAPAEVLVLGYKVCPYTPSTCAKAQPKTASTRPGAQCGALSARHYPKHVLKRVNGETRVRRRASRRIVGGREAVPHSYPWQVSMNWRRARDHGPDCGGALVGRQWALTAAHCVYINATRLKRASALEVNLGRHYAVTGGRPVGVAEIVPHPLYLDSYGDYDIALLRLDRAVGYSDKIRPICLPGADDDYRRRIGLKTIVTGWGYEHDSSGREVRAPALKEVVVPVAEPGRCRNAQVSGIYAEREMCAGGEAGRDSCGGDSGGPLHVLRGDHLVLAGLVARGHQVCGTAGYPAVYTDVAAFVPWIESVTRL